MHSSFGLKVGLAFQLQDLLNLVGNARRAKTRSDITEGKHARGGLRAGILAQQKRQNNSLRAMLSFSANGLMESVMR